MPISGIESAAEDDSVANLVAALTAASTASLQKSANLSDVASPSASRTSLGLGSAATMSTAQVAADSALTSVFGKLAGSNTWTGSQDFTGATVTGVTGSGGSATKGSAFSTQAVQYTWADDMASGWTDPLSQGTVAHDSSVKRSGTGSVKVIAPSSGSAAGMRLTFAAKDFSTSNFRLDVRSDAWQNVSSAQIRFFTDASNYYYLSLGQYHVDLDANSVLSWQDCWFGKHKFTAQGSPNWASIAFVQVQVSANAGQTPTVWFDNVAAYKTATKPAISITFDDGWDSQYNVAPSILEPRGIIPTLFIIPGRVGTSNYVTQAQIDELAAKGWEIGGHADTDLSTMSAAAAEVDVAAAATYVAAHGYKGGHMFAYPNGRNTETLRRMVQKYFAVGRTINDLNQPLGNVAPYRVNASSVGNWAQTSGSNARATNYIDEAITEGTWVVFTFHKIVNTTPVNTLETNANDLIAILDYAIAAGIDIRPMGRVLGEDRVRAASVETVNVPKRSASTPSVGSGSTSSAWDHVHPRTFWAPEDHSLLTWTYDPSNAVNPSATITSGTLYGGQVYLPVATTITNIVMYVATAGSTLTSGQSFAGLYDSGGSLVATTADQATSWASTGAKTMALTTPYSAVAGRYSVAYFSVGTTPPLMLCSSTNQRTIANIGLLAATARYFQANTGLTTALPASISGKGGNGNALWIGLS